MSFRSITTLGLAAVVALPLLLAAGSVSAQSFGGREELAASGGSIRIVLPGGTGSATTPGSGSENRVGKRTFKIVRVTPLDGQNPLNQESPALNFDGQTFDNATDLQNAADGNNNNNNNGNDACTGQTINSAIENFGVDFAFAGISLDSNTGDCFLRNDGEGPLLIFQFPGSGGSALADDRLDIFPDALVNEFTLLNPAPTAGSGVNSPFGLFTFTLRAINGKVFDVTFNVVKVSGDVVGAVLVNPAFTLTVNSIIQTN
jgi:hypothetical protein